MSTTSSSTLDLADLAERTHPSVVRIGRSGGRGNGVVIAPDQILTAAHNLRDRTTSVTFADGRSVQGSVTGVDPEGDLVVLAVATEGAPVANWAEPPTLGGTVVGVATLGDGAVRAVAGNVTATGRRYRGPSGRIVTDALEHDASLGKGTSGGPLFDAEGAMVGVNVRRERDGFTLTRPATPELRELVDRLARGESVVPVRLGITVGAPEAAARLREAAGLEPRDGVFVAGVAEGSPAEGAGVRRGDVLIAAAGTEVTTAEGLHQVLGQVDRSQELTIRVVRATEELDLTVTFTAEHGDDGEDTAADS